MLISNTAAVDKLKPDSPLLQSVLRLAKSNSATLGFLPNGAFEERARSGQILAAVNSEGRLLGYLVYRIANLQATKMQLCVAPDLQHQGVARLLFGQLVTCTQNLHAIVAKCRRDFPANSLWPKLGFAAMGDIPGRGRDRKPLTIWRYEHHHETLFSMQAKGNAHRPPTHVGIDLNIFYDIHDDRPSSEESRALEADWLTDEIQLCLTIEAFNEINRLDDSKKRESQLNLAKQYERLAAQHSVFQTIQKNWWKSLANRKLKVKNQT